MAKRDKGRLSDFVPLLRETMATPAWRQLSHGARSLYVALKSRTTKHRNTAFLSYRDAKREIGSHQRSIKRWFDELQHYGFIVLHAPGHLGVDGKGKAPHYRLTELGKTRAASDDGEFEPPTKDYLRWDGTVFEPPKRRNNTTLNGSNRVPRLRKKQNPVSHVGYTPYPTGVTPLYPTGVTPKR